MGSESENTLEPAVVSSNQLQIRYCFKDLQMKRRHN